MVTAKSALSSLSVRIKAGCSTENRRLPGHLSFPPPRRASSLSFSPTSSSPSSSMPALTTPRLDWHDMPANPSPSQSPAHTHSGRDLPPFSLQAYDARYPPQVLTSSMYSPHSPSAQHRAIYPIPTIPSSLQPPHDIHQTRYAPYPNVPQPMAHPRHYQLDPRAPAGWYVAQPVYRTAPVAPPPPPVPHKVWILDCKSCGIFLTNRGMKVSLYVIAFLSFAPAAMSCVIEAT
ncbi:hypothetical protein K474DRAFT_1419920 [Panus rudis PR-1116 ss-1]|nr:hypothetical protein K474DRAFT_1419920 [Panus rudis PR-1116 ss-1]